MRAALHQGQRLPKEVRAARVARAVHAAGHLTREQAAQAAGVRASSLGGVLAYAREMRWITGRWAGQGGVRARTGRAADRVIESDASFISCSGVTGADVPWLLLLTTPSVLVGVTSAKAIRRWGAPSDISPEKVLPPDEPQAA
jgi:hypothetical protein